MDKDTLVFIEERTNTGLSPDPSFQSSVEGIVLDGEVDTSRIILTKRTGTQIHN